MATLEARLSAAERRARERAAAAERQTASLQAELDAARQAAAAAKHAAAKPAAPVWPSLSLEAAFLSVHAGLGQVSEGGWRADMTGPRIMPSWRGAPTAKHAAAERAAPKQVSGWPWVVEARLMCNLCAGRRNTPLAWHSGALAMLHKCRLMYEDMVMTGGTVRSCPQCGAGGGRRCGGAHGSAQQWSPSRRCGSCCLRFCLKLTSWH